MIDRLVELEQQRLEQLGYTSIVTPAAITIGKPAECFVLSNDTYILTGIRVSQGDLVGTDSTLHIISPTGVLTGTAKEISMLGTSTNVLFKNNLIVKVCNALGEFVPQADICPFTLHFIKISPQRNSY